MKKYLFVWCLAVASLQAAESSAGVLSELLDAAGRSASRRITREAAESAVRTSSQQVAWQLGEEAAENAARQIAQRQAAGSLAGVAASGASTRLAADAAVLVEKIKPQSARRLAMMADDIERSGQAERVVSLLAQDAAADQIIDFLWRNKATIAGGTVIAAVLANPAAAMAAGADVTKAVIQTTGEHVARPAIESTAQHVVGPTVSQNLGVVGIWLLIALLVASVLFKLLVKPAHVARAGRLLQYMRKEKSR